MALALAVAGCLVLGRTALVLLWSVRARSCEWEYVEVTRLLGVSSGHAKSNFLEDATAETRAAPSACVDENAMIRCAPGETATPEKAGAGTGAGTGAAAATGRTGGVRAPTIHVVALATSEGSTDPGAAHAIPPKPTISSTEAAFPIHVH